MAKLTETERQALNNACARLRETNLGTKIGNVEDFLDINVLKTDANTVSAAINELFDKWANPLLNITIPPPGFFTLAGDAEGNLWCYCNDETNPPVFEHDEDTGDLYLYIASEDGENSYKVHVGNYIAVKHLNDYYKKTEVDTKVTSLETSIAGKANSNHTHDDRYYTEAEVDTKVTALENAINSLVGFTAEVVSSLPATGQEGIMYLVLSESGVEQDIYNEYIWVENKFEKIGNTSVEVDLSGYATINLVNSTLANYVTDSELTTALNSKANSNHSHSVATTSANGFMSSNDKSKLDGIATGANKTTVDSAMSSTSTNPVQNKIIYAAIGATSTNPVQNKVVKAQLDSLNNNKANTGHTHNDYSATVTVPCEYGTVKKFKKNGWAFVVYENMDISTVPKDTWTTLADIGWSNQAGNSYTTNFQTTDANINRFRINVEGQLVVWRVKDSYNTGYYGYFVYPTAD